MTVLIAILCILAAGALFGVGYIAGATGQNRKLARREAAAREVAERSRRAIATSLGDNYRPGITPPRNPFDGSYDR